MVRVLAYRAALASHTTSSHALQATPLVAGLSMAGAALLARQGLLSYAAWRAAAPVARAMRDKGAFKPTMDRLEAAKILGVRRVCCVRARERPLADAAHSRAPRRQGVRHAVAHPAGPPARHQGQPPGRGGQRLHRQQGAATREAGCGMCVARRGECSRPASVPACARVQVNEAKDLLLRRDTSTSSF